MHRYNTTLLLLAALVLWGCKDQPTKASDVAVELPTEKVRDQAATTTVWQGTKKHSMTNESATIQLPIAWQRSTRARLENRDMPPSRMEALKIIQKSLSQMAYDDSVIDVWEADVQDYHGLLLLNTDTIGLTRGVVSQLSRSQQKSYKEIDEATPGVSIQVADSSYKEDDSHQVAKYKYSFAVGGDTTYLTTYYITIPTRSFIGYELAEEKLDVELYVYSLL